ncbi:11469_t:CDS:2, partial [Acaulospora colombiana]
FSTEIHPPLGLMDFALDRQAHATGENVQGDSLVNSMSTLPVTQPTVISDEEEFEDMDSEAGDTTDDEILTSGMPGLPPTTVAPDATLTPARVLATLHPFPPVFPSPSPSNILAVGKTTYPWDCPRLGFFRGANFGSKRTIIGDADGKLPSPFSNLTPAAP